MKTFIILKPDCLHRNLQFKLMGEIGLLFKIETAKMVITNRELIEKHYEEHKDKPFFNELVNFMAGKKVYIAICESKIDPDKTVELMRELVGPTDGSNSASLRGKYRDKNKPKMFNLIHSSDSNQAAERETKLWMDFVSKN